MSKAFELIRAESRFQSFFGYLPGAMERVAILKSAGYRFTMAKNGKACSLFVAKARKSAAKYTLAKLSELLEFELSVDNCLSHVPIERIVSACGGELVRGELVSEYYEKAHGSNTCMSGSDSFKAAIYGANPESCALLIGHNSFLCDSFRAIVWQDSRGLKVDRVYGNQSRVAVPHAIAGHYANELGLKLRTRSACGSHFVDNNGKKIHARFTLNWDSDAPLPYMDTVKFLYSFSDDTVTIGTRNSDYVKQLNSTSGESADGTEPEPRCSCESCGCEVNEEELYHRDWYSGGYCEDCDNDATSYCECCEESCSQEDSHYVELQRNGRSSHSMSFCDYCYSNEVIKLHNGEYALSDDCQELHNGEYALSDDCQELHDGTYALTDDCQELHDGTYALTDDPAPTQLELCVAGDNPSE